MRWASLSRRRRMLVAGVALLVVVLVSTVAVHLVRFGSAHPAGPPDQNVLGPVLLVPGYGGSQGSLTALADRIRATGRPAVVVALPGDGTDDLLAQAETLQTAVSDQVDRGAPSVDVVGYSAGGVVVRLWVAEHNGATVARRVVTLGAPLHGARIAAVGTALVPGACPVACQQLVPGSAVLDRLDRQPLPAQLPWLSIWTEDDQTVQPPDSARLDGAVNVAVQQVCPGAHVPHGQLPADPVVIGMVLRAVGSAPLVPPTPSVCGAT